MVDLLTHLLDNLICWIESAIILFTNLLIAGIAEAVGAIVSILPAMPDIGSLPDWVSTAASHANYYFPVDFLVALGVTFFGFWLVWFGVSILLRWAKVLGGKA